MIQSWSRSAQGAAVLLLAFAILFALGGWGAIGKPPKPFVPAEGFFISGTGLQTVALAVLCALILARQGTASGLLGLVMALDAGLALLWRIAALAALVTVSLIFLWASGRFLFGMSAFPPASFPFSLAETWWIEVALASLGLSLTLSIPAILRTGEHVTIDILSPVLAPRVHRWIMRVGSLVLGLPVGWLLLTKGSHLAARSWQQWESSQNFGIEFVFLVKTLVPLMGFLIAVVAALNLRGTPVQKHTGHTGP